MRLRDLPGYARDTLLRMLPHRAPTGLVRIGRPGRESPVLLTGNYTLTVRRMRQALAGRDAWLLCANSRGINVWCAAGGGHLTHHDVVSVLRTSGIGDRVDHRELILPQLCATGVERRKVTALTGWRARWGPARLEDLADFLDRRGGVRKAQRFMRFPLWERLEMAVMWGGPMLLLGGPLVAWLAGGAGLAAVAAAVLSVVGGMFLLLPWLRVTGPWRWPTHLLFAVVGTVAGTVLARALGASGPGPLALAGGAAVVAAGLLALDLPGTTPWYGSAINTWRNEAHIELVESRCTGAAECVQVCPRDVLQMDGPRRKVAIARPGQCIQCGACIVQCPVDALRFRYDDGRVVEAPVIRGTRMNMVGRRTVQVRD